MTRKFGQRVKIVKGPYKDEEGFVIQNLDKDDVILVAVEAKVKRGVTYKLRLVWEDDTSLIG